MAQYKVTITYVAPTKEPEQLIAPICRIYAPEKSYIDTPVYEGTDVPYKEVPEIGEDGNPTGKNVAVPAYGKSIYATNVKHWGELPIPEPYASTSIPFPIPLAQFKVAMVGEPNTDAEGKEIPGSHVTFVVDDYSEAFYYKQAGVALKSQGFSVEVEAVDADASTKE